MAGNLQIPTDVTKVIKIVQTDEPLRKFLTELLNKVSNLEARVKELEDAN